MKRRISTICFGLLFLAGFGILSYPTVSDRWNAYRQQRLISEYDETVSTMKEEDYQIFWEQAHAYNESLWTRSSSFTLTEEEEAEYRAVLNVSGSGMMGYVEIPRINCSLPVCHGTDEEVLQTAVGHLEGTSVPAGGEGTHCVLSAHRGLPSAKLFSNLDQMENGDIFRLKILNETLTYQVDQIRTVLPAEVEDLGLVAGMDYCTLVTCTPYGVNTHRLLVRGVRIENIEEPVEEGTDIPAEEKTGDRFGWLWLPALGIPALFLALAYLLFRYRKK